MHNKPLIVECEVQGIAYKELSFEEGISWIENEVNFWFGLAPYLDLDTNIDGYALRSPEINNSYNRKLNQIKSELVNRNGVGFLNYIESAKLLKCVLSEGQLGQQIKSLISENKLEISQALCLGLSEDVHPRWNEYYRKFVSTIIGLRFGPMPLQNISLSAAKEASEASNKNAVKIADLQNQLENYAKEKSQELETLKKRYEVYLELDGPAKHWKSVARTAFWTGAISLAIFVLLIGTSIWVINSNWNEISGYIDHLIQMSNGGISLAPLIIFSIPLLSAGWLLKHVSRIFVQSLQTYADAEHRHVMANTFLGLAERNNVGISEAERAIVLNAMFRPGPSSPQDDGPPMGLLDLLGKR